MKERLPGLDSVRAIGALMIMLYHLSNLITCLAALGTIRTFGSGVQLFFILSGFSLFWGYCGRLNDNESVKKYLVQRFLRIAPIFYLMIFVWGVFFYFLGYNYSSGEYLVNFTFVFNLFPGLHASIVQAGWAVGVLVIFYLIFPIIITIVKRALVSFALLILSLFLCSFYYQYLGGISGLSASYPYMSFVFQFPFFAMGIFLYYIVEKVVFKDSFLKKKSTKIIGACLFLGSIGFYSLAIWYDGPFIWLLNQIPFINASFYLSWFLVFSCMILGVIFFPWKGIVNRISKFLGKQSYSIYLLHPFIILQSIPVYNGIFGLISDINFAFILSFLYTVFIVSITSYVTYRLIERPAINYGSPSILEKIPNLLKKISK